SSLNWKHCCPICYLPHQGIHPPLPVLVRPHVLSLPIRSNLRVLLGSLMSVLQLLHPLCEGPVEGLQLVHQPPVLLRPLLPVPVVRRPPQVEPTHPLLRHVVPSQGLPEVLLNGRLLPLQGGEVGFGSRRLDADFRPQLVAVEALGDGIIERG